MAYVLVVEDDPDQRDLFAHILCQAKYKVESAADGRHALASILFRRPDVLLLDLCLPEMDGTALLEVMRSYIRLQSVPVVVITGLGDSPLVEHARSLNPSSVLTKAQAMPADILQAVAAALPN
jgi:CheY-like chemotaxis protein